MFQIIFFYTEMIKYKTKMGMKLITKSSENI